MSVNAAFFYLFATIMVGSGFMVIASRNPVQSVLFLILAFVNAAGLFLLMGGEVLALIGVVFLLELILVVGAYVIDPALVRSPGVPIPPADVMTNTEALGQVLYTRYFYFFQAAGLILLVAMIGAIVLTLRERVGVRRQDISKQNARTQETAVEVRKVPFRQGI